MKTYSFDVTAKVSQKVSIKSGSLQEAREIADNYTMLAGFDETESFSVDETEQNSDPYEDDEQADADIFLNDEDSSYYLDKERKE